MCVCVCVCVFIYIVSVLLLLTADFDFAYNNLNNNYITRYILHVCNGGNEIEDNDNYRNSVASVLFPQSIITTSSPRSSRTSSIHLFTFLNDFLFVTSYVIIATAESRI